MTVAIGGALLLLGLLILGGLVLANGVRKATRFEDARACRIYAINLESRAYEKTLNEAGRIAESRARMAMSLGARQAALEVEGLPGGCRYEPDDSYDPEAL